MLQAPLKRKRGRINESVEQPELYNQGYNNSSVNPLLGTDNLIRSLNQAVENRTSRLSDEEKAGNGLGRREQFIIPIILAREYMN